MIKDIASAIVGGLDDLFTSDEEKMKAELALMKELNKPHHLQALTNIKASSHSSVFVAGARPFVLWVCGFAFAYATIIEPILRFVATMAGYAGEFPVLDTTLTMQALTGLLGFGAMRSFDKYKGSDTKRIGKE